MNLIKALEGLSAKPDNAAAEQTPPSATQSERPSPGAEQETQIHNVMADVIERHERISNRVRSGGAPRK